MELVITEFGASLGKQGKCLVVRRQGQPPIDLPAEEVDFISVTGKGITLSSDAVQLMMEHDACLTFFSMSGEPYARLASPRQLTQAELRHQQLLAHDDERGMALARRFISAKLRNQVATLRYFAKSRKETAPEAFETISRAAEAIETLNGEVENMAETTLAEGRERLMNREALAAKHYWQAVGHILPADIAFPGRVQKGATDPFNAVLNYGYGILYSRIWSILMTVGLDPYAGYLHTYRDGQPTLVFDFIEQFRQFAVDRPVMALFTKKWRPQFDETGLMDADTRKDLAGRILEHFHSRAPYDGKSLELMDIMKAEAYALPHILRRESVHQPFVAPW